MLKRYRVTWRTPDKTGSIEIENDDFSEIGHVALQALFPPPGCPTEITKIELLEPAAIAVDLTNAPAYIRRVPPEHLAGLGIVNERQLPPIDDDPNVFDASDLF